MGEEGEKAGKESIEELENAIMRNFRIPFRITREVFTGKKRTEPVLNGWNLRTKCVLILKCTADAVSITFLQICNYEGKPRFKWWITCGLKPNTEYGNNNKKQLSLHFTFVRIWLYFSQSFKSTFNLAVILGLLDRSKGGEGIFRLTVFFFFFFP